MSRKKVRIWMVMLLILTVIAGCGKSVEQQIAEQLELGQKYLAELDYEQAIIAFNKVIELEPNESKAYVGLLNTYIELNDKGKAETVMNECHDKFIYNNEAELDDVRMQEIIQASIKFYDVLGSIEQKYYFLKRLSEKYPENEEYSSLADKTTHELFQYYVGQADSYTNISNLDDALECLTKAYEISPESNIEIRIKALQNGGKYYAEDGQTYDAFGNIVEVPSKTQEELFAIVSSKFPYDMWGQHYHDYDKDGREELFADGRNIMDNSTYHICYCSSDGETVLELGTVSSEAYWTTTGYICGRTADVFYIAFSDSDENVENKTYSDCYVYALDNGIPKQVLSVEKGEITGGENGLNSYVNEKLN